MILDLACNPVHFALIVQLIEFGKRIDRLASGDGGIGMTIPPRHPRFERAAAALRENLKRRKAQTRARVSGSQQSAPQDGNAPTTQQKGQEEH